MITMRRFWSDCLNSDLEAGLSRYRQLAAEFADSLQRRKSALAVAPTWREIAEVSEEIRRCLKERVRKDSGAGVPPAIGASRPSIFAGETPGHRRPETRATT